MKPILAPIHSDTILLRICIMNWLQIKKWQIKQHVCGYLERWVITEKTLQDTIYVKIYLLLHSSRSSKAKNTGISKTDAISIGYLSDEFVRNILQDKKIKINIKKRHYTECNYADIFIDNQNYADLLKNSGFAICNNRICNQELFNKKLE